MYDNKWTYKDRDNGYLQVMVHLRDETGGGCMLFIQASGIKGSVGEELCRREGEIQKNCLQSCITVSAAESITGISDDYVASMGAG